MAALDTNTDLFDLFGQGGTCSVCMEDMQEGERVRAVHGCDHLFHAACVEPWLLSRGTCPMCRTPVVQVQAAPAALASTTEALETVRAAVQGLSPSNGGQLQSVLEQIETLLGQTRGNLVIRRHLLTYCFGLGVAARFPTATAFNEIREGLRERLEANEFRFEDQFPFALDCSSRTAFCNSFRVSGGAIQSVSRSLTPAHQSADFNGLQNRLRSARPASQFLRDFWRTD